jgi:hypothetical protein
MSKRLCLRSLVVATAGIVLAACSNDTPSETSRITSVTDSAGSAANLGVNAYLWRASLDAVSFMPMASEDPFGGVIITDWYSPAESPTERFKVNVYIVDRQLRSDGVHATIFKQNKTPDGHWIDAPIDPKTQADFENAILTRARQLRITAIQLNK